MTGGIKISGTDLNRSMTADLSTASKLYNQESSEGLLGNIINIVKGILTLDIDKILKELGNIVDLGLDLFGSIKNRILEFIYSLLGRDMSGLSKLSLTERSGLSPHNGCNFNLNSNLDGVNLNIAGYSIASLLAMLLCAGVKGIFSLIDGIINIGIATVQVVAGAISDVLKFIVGGDTLNVITDLGKSIFAPQLSKSYSDPANMLLDAIGKNTVDIGNPVGAFTELVSGMDIMAPDWLGGDNFNLNKVRENKVIQSLSNSVNLENISKPITEGYNINKVFNPTEKISMFSGSNKLKSFF